MSNKMASLAVYIITLTALLTGCGGSSDKQAEYTVHEDQIMKLTIELPAKEYADGTVRYSPFAQNGVSGEYDPIDGSSFSFMPIEVSGVTFFDIQYYAESTWDEWIGSGKTPDEITGKAASEEIGRSNGMVYLYCPYELNTNGMSDEIKSEYERMLDMLPYIKASIKLTVPPTANTGVFPEFQTTDLSGNFADSNLFAENKLTMLNIWGTFCGPCIEEMPDLAVMDENMPEGTAIVGLITDALDEERIELAKKIVAETDVKYTNLITDEALNNYVNEYVIGAPMTIFIDSSGNIEGDALIGAKSVEVYTEELMTRLESSLLDEGAAADVPDGTQDIADVQTQQTELTLDGLVQKDFTLKCSFQNKEEETWSERTASFSMSLPSDWEIDSPKGTGTQFFASYKKNGEGVATILLREKVAGINPMFQNLFSDIDSDSSSFSKDLKIAGYPARLYRINEGSGWFVVAPDEFPDMYIEVSFVSAAGTEEEMEAVMSTLSVK